MVCHIDSGDMSKEEGGADFDMVTCRHCREDAHIGCLTEWVKTPLYQSQIQLCPNLRDLNHCNDNVEFHYADDFLPLTCCSCHGIGEPVLPLDEEEDEEKEKEEEEDDEKKDERDERYEEEEEEEDDEEAYVLVDREEPTYNPEERGEPNEEEMLARIYDGLESHGDAYSHD